MTCCDVLQNGRPADGGAADGPFAYEVITLNATPVNRLFADLTPVGSSVNYTADCSGVLDIAGQQARAAYYLFFWGVAATNSFGTNGNAPTAIIGPTGTTDPAAPPWTAPGAVPAGWGGVAPGTIVGSSVGITIIGAAATRIRWNILVTLNLSGGATRIP